MKKILQVMACLILLILITNYLQAQPSLPSVQDPDGAPIDGGLSLLLAAGVGYGAKKIKEARKRK